ncbi:3'-to-5' exoribonuclease RNase R [Clostridium sp. CAG:567]|nr:3'-to-5' exoribonuclease RNase R [Clostridium sp. CAG:567]
MKEEIKKENQEFEKDKYVGVFQKSKNFGFVVLDDKKIKTDIYISKKNSKKAKNNQKVVVQILKLPEKNKKAEGKILEILGNINQAGVDMMSLIKEYDLPYEFPESVINEAKAIKQEVSKKDIPNRLDLRNKIIFTVDGEDAKDLDDAVSVEKLKNGNYLLNVSIADVSYYVQEKSKLDKEAIIRGTSIYMLDRVIPMLPKELSNGICSLNQKEDRFAITVLMEINSKGEVVSSDIQKSIIKVTRRMSYKEVQTILDVINNEEDKKIFNLKDKEKLLEECKPYFEHFKRMEELANILKQKREKAGSLYLDIPESKITLNEQGVAIKVEKYDMYFANEIIEQFMLTANETVAEKFYWLEAPFIYRVHEVPDEEKIDELNKFLWNLGYKIKGNKDNIHPKAFAEVLEEVKGKPEERVVSNLVLRTLKVARYEAENKGHFGIASKYYCHFTSPIRRYPDLFIHRIISKYLEENYQLKESEIEKYSGQAVKYAQRSSEREKIAQKVERDAESIKKAEYMQSKIGKEYEGIISSITSFGMFVELPNTVEGLIHFEDLGNEYFIYDEERKTLQGEKSKKTYKIGDSIKVCVIFADKLTRKVDFEKISS